MAETHLGWHETRAEATETGFVRHSFYVGREANGFYYYYGDNPTKSFGPFGSSKEAHDLAMNGD